MVINVPAAGGVLYGETDTDARAKEIWSGLGIEWYDLYDPMRRVGGPASRYTFGRFGGHLYPARHALAAAFIVDVLSLRQAGARDR